MELIKSYSQLKRIKEIMALAPVVTEKSKKQDSKSVGTFSKKNSNSSSLLLVFI